MHLLPARKFLHQYSTQLQKRYRLAHRVRWVHQLDELEGFVNCTVNSAIKQLKIDR